MPFHEHLLCNVVFICVYHASFVHAALLYIGRGNRLQWSPPPGGRARIPVRWGIKLDKERVLDRSIHGAPESQRIILTQSQISGSKHEQRLYAVPHPEPGDDKSDCIDSKSGGVLWRRGLNRVIGALEVGAAKRLWSTQLGSLEYADDRQYMVKFIQLTPRRV